MRKAGILFVVVFTVLMLSSDIGRSYVRSPLGNGNGMPIAWNLTNPGTNKVANGRIIYNLNPVGSDDVPFAQVEQALMSSFRTWEDIPTSVIAFTRGPNTTATTTTNDDVLQVYWLESTTTTADGLNIAGALAVSRLTTFTTGSRTGEIIDGALVFNGNQFTWAVDGRAGSVDIAEVATHEIGHLIGISHSPIGGTSMFPRTGMGRTRGRSLESDDRIVASVIYPAGGFSTSTGSIVGRVRDGSGAAIFGAHVVAVDSNGNVACGALSQTDGSYSIQGLPPGSYTIYAEPIDPTDRTSFSKADLPGFYTAANLDFQTSGDQQVSVAGGQQVSRDITVTRGNPVLDSYIVFDAANSAFLNIGTSAAQGQSNVTIGVAGPGLPQSGTPLSISGSGITILRQYFRTTSNSLPAVLADISVSSTAPVGLRNIIVSNGSQRAIMTGGLEIVASGGIPQPSLVTVASAANFRASVAAESLVSLFGTNLAGTTQAATTNPPPTAMGPTTVRLRDSMNNDRLAPLFFISPNQINIQIAPGIQIGNTSISVLNGTTLVGTGTFQLAPVSPGLFSANASGQGLASAVALRIRNGQQTFERISTISGSQVTPIPIDLGPTTDQVFLVLFGTGVRFSSSLPTCNVGGANMQVTFAGAQGSLIGLDQINVRLDRSLIGRGAVNVQLTANGMTSNVVSVTIK